MGWGAKAPPPDPRIADAAAQTAATGQEALDWYKNYQATVLAPAAADLRTSTDSTRGTLDQITAAQLAEAQGSLDYRDKTFRPLEQDLVAQARDMNTADYAARKASQASADVETAYQRAEAARRMDDARMGIAPSSGVARAEAQNLALRAAAGKAGAMTTARDQAESLKFDRGMAAAGLGKTLTSDAARSAQIASGTSAASLEAESNYMSQLQRNAQSMGAGFSAASQASQAAGGLYGTSSGQNIQGRLAASGQNQEMVGTGVGAAATVAAAVIL